MANKYFGIIAVVVVIALISVAVYFVYGMQKEPTGNAPAPRAHCHRLNCVMYTASDESCAGANCSSEGCATSCPSSYCCRIASANLTTCYGADCEGLAS